MNFAEPMRRARREQTWSKFGSVLFSDYAWRRWMASVPAPAEAFRYRHRRRGGPRVPAGRPAAARRRSRSLITAGFHGDEKAGPLTLLEHAAEIVDYAAARGRRPAPSIPCINPSGFEAHTRYNVTGERPNNDFLRYEIAPGPVARRAARRRAVPRGSRPPPTASRRRLPRWRASWTPGRPRPRRSICTRTTSSTGRLLRVHLRRSRGLPAAAGARRARWCRSCAAASSTRGTSRGRDVRADAEGFIICPRRQHHRPLPPRRRPLRRGDRDHHRDARRAGRRDQPHLDPRASSTCVRLKPVVRLRRSFHRRGGR